MSPIIAYRCPRGHEYETLYKTIASVPSPHLPEYCPVCGSQVERLLAAPNLKPDGAYSFADNRRRD